LEGKQYPLEITGEGDKLSGKIETIKQTRDPKKGTIKTDTLAPKVNVQLISDDITLQFNIDDDNWKGSVNLHGKVSSKFGVFEGDGMLPTGKWIQWTAIRNSDVDVKKDEKTASIDTAFSSKLWFPNMAYGFDQVPEVETIVFRGATVWTNEPGGILKDATVITQGGKITYVGTGSYMIPNGAKVIDAKGKHVTSGIIDEHSHIAISKGVNEGGQAVSAEVSIADVVNPDDINIYRQLSGGVTAAQLLHGSANPIGGQSALIKLKWGHSPEEMVIPNSPKFIKCALGENVKQANWGDYNTVRFPQTRMGVEQVFLDGFNRAKIYQKEWDAYTKSYASGKVAPRKDLELEVLSEILRSERFITCHSYVQSEINMLMHVADSMNFRINTFTHILEGYKLADKMLRHGAGASTFSDWWAYKFEVNDAIPYNAALMNKMGLTVAINSDDAEMGRRLNQEAAKGVKYGGISEEEAWKMVTLNPAKLLHLDDRMGSLKEGKDADIVLWTNNPLSIDAKVEMTVVDGKVLFDSKRDYIMRSHNQAEKARIITEMLKSNEKGEGAKPFVKKRSRHFHCDTLGEEGSEGENTH
jgi:imidazolonepropionase-like amidohydrolase